MDLIIVKALFWPNKTNEIKKNGRRPQKKMKNGRRNKKMEKNGRRPNFLVEQAQICEDGCEGSQSFLVHHFHGLNFEEFPFVFCQSKLTNKFHMSSILTLFFMFIYNFIIIIILQCHEYYSCTCSSFVHCVL
jgi:hypothetical protein